MIGQRPTPIERNTVVHLCGEYDLARAVELFHAVAIGSCGPVVTVDCAGVTFIDGSGLGALLRAARVLECDRCLMVLRNVPRLLGRLIEVTETSDRLVVLDAVHHA